MTSDNDFDDLLAAADDLIVEKFGVLVSVNGSEPVKAIYDEVPNEFDVMAGTLRKLTFQASLGVRPRKGDRIEFIRTGVKQVVSSGPYPDNGNLVVYL